MDQRAAGSGAWQQAKGAGQDAQMHVLLALRAATAMLVFLWHEELVPSHPGSRTFMTSIMIWIYMEVKPSELSQGLFTGLPQ